MLLRSMLGALALACASTAAIASGDTASRCVDISVPKGAISARDGKWIELTPEQWQFLRGVYVVNPDTPPTFANIIGANVVGGYIGKNTQQGFSNPCVLTVGNTIRYEAATPCL
jgi:hypothetical protein